MSYFRSICRRECLSSWQSCRRLAVVTQSTWLIRRPGDCRQQLKNIAIDLLVPALFFFSFCFGVMPWLHLFCGYPFCAQSRQCDFRGENGLSRGKVGGEEGWGREFVNVDCPKVVEIEGMSKSWWAWRHGRCCWYYEMPMVMSERLGISHPASVVTFVTVLTLPASLHL